MTAPSSRGLRGRAFALAAPAVLAMLAAPVGWRAGASQISEEQVQATMLLQVVKFVDWPEQSAAGQMRICVLGGGRFQAALEGAARNETWHGRPISVVGIEKVSQAGDCQVTFVGAASERDIQALIGRHEGPVLTVSHRDGFARRGGMVNFVNDQGRIGLEVNKGAGERAGIRFSSKLLRLVRVVQSGVVN